MSQTIDKRIVEMEFQNRSFESGIKESIDSLEKLKRGLNFEDATRGLSDLERAGRSFSLSGIADGIDAIANKFSTLGIVGITVLQNLTNRAVDLGIQLAKSLSIDQITAGWSKYEQKTSSVQTIINATGKTLEEVNGYLDKLMWFSDETSYSFSDMTAALAQMTSSGGNIDNLIPLITGVANATAYAGKGAMEFSRAMYNLNQSYGAGFLQYMDWKSLELAGVASQQLKQVFIDTAKSMGRLSKEGKTVSGELVTIANFGTTLKDKWADTAVMEAAFGKFAELSEAAYQLVQSGQYETAADAMAALSGQYSEIAEKAFKSAQQAKSLNEAIEATKDAVSSGWMKTFEIIIGDFEEATKFWTDVTGVLWEVFASGAESRNEMLQAWKDLGGRDSMIESLWNLIDALRSIIRPIKDAFHEIFPPMTAERLYAITEGIRAFTEKIKIGDKTSENLKNTFEGLFAIVSILKQALEAIGSAAGGLIKFLLPAGEGLLDITGKIGKYISALDDTIKKSDTFNKFFEKLGDALQPIVEKFNDGFGSIREVFARFADIDLSGVDAFTETLEIRFRPLHTLFKFVGTIFNFILDIIQGVMPYVEKAFNAIGESLRQIGEKISVGDFSGVFDLLNSGLFAGILIGIRKFIKNLGDVTGEGKGILESIKDIFGGLGETLEAFQQRIKSGVILKIAGAIALLAASILVLSMIDSEKLTTAMVAISTLFGELIASMAILTAITKDATFKNTTKATASMISMSVAIIVLAVAMEKLSDLDWEGIGKGLTAVTVLMTDLVMAAHGLSGIEGKIFRTSISLIAFSAALSILADVVQKLGALDLASLAKGLGGVGLLIGELTLFTKFADLDSMGISKGVGLIALSTAIVILASAVEKIGAIDIPTLIKGVSAIGVLLGELVVFLNLTQKAKNVTSTAIGMTILAASMLIFSKAIADMGSMPLEQIGKGLLAMGVALAEVTVALNFLPKNTVSKAVALVGVASALVIMAGALKNMGGMSWEEIGKSLVALAGAFMIFVAALKFLPNSLSGAAAILVISAALAVLTPCLKALGGMTWEEIAKGLLALAGAFTVIGLAGLALGPLVPAILGLSASITLLGVGVAAIGAGVMLLSIGLSGLSVSLVAAGSAIVTFLGILLEGFNDLIPTISEIIRNLVIVILEVFNECLPSIIDSILQFIIKVLESLISYGPQIISLLADLIVKLLEGLTNEMPRLVEAGVNFILSFFSSIIDALKKIDTDILLKAIGGVGLLSALVVAFSSLTPLIPGAMAGVLGLAGLVAEIAVVLAGFGALAQIPGLTWLIGEGGQLLEAVGVAIGSFVGGIIGGLLGGITGQFPQIANDLSQFMVNLQPFIEGARNIDPSMMAGVQALGEVILMLTAANILDGLTKWFTGGSSVVRFGQELAQFGPHFNEYYNSIKSIDGTVVQASANAAKALSEMAANLPNQGGVVNWFVGENSLTVFAEELKKFGPSLKQYADSVRGVDPSVVQASANAAKTLSEMAANLPNQGGIVSWFTGDNTLSIFAEELKKFGPGIKAYADSVRGLDVNVVNSSINAAQSLAEMAKALPNQGGIVSWFVGDNTLSDFAEELSVFGPYLRAYANSVRGVDASVVLNSANAAKSLSELAANLPNQGGLISWFTGDNDLSTFGKKLAEFGQSFTNYYNSVYTVDTNKLYGISQELSRLIEMAKGIKNIDTSGMSNFANTLKNLGKSGIDQFIKAFTDANNRVKSAAETLVENASTGANNKKSSFISTFTDLITNALNEFSKKYTNFKDTAKECISQFINGINDKKRDIQTAASSTITGLINEIRGQYNSFHSAGAYLVTGFVNGIKDNLFQASNKGKELAEAALKASKKALDIRSPSREFYEVGEYASLGFVNALDDYTDKSFGAGSAMAENAKNGLTGALAKIARMIENNIDAEPTIRPVLDLSNIQNGSRLLNSIFSEPYTLTGLRSMSLASAVSVPSKFDTPRDIPTNTSGNTETIQNNFNISELVVREEADYRRIARELYNMQVASRRG